MKAKHKSSQPPKSGRQKQQNQVKFSGWEKLAMVLSLILGVLFLVYLALCFMQNGIIIMPGVALAAMVFAGIALVLYLFTGMLQVRKKLRILLLSCVCANVLAVMGGFVILFLALSR